MNRQQLSKSRKATDELVLRPTKQLSALVGIREYAKENLKQDEKGIYVERKKFKNKEKVKLLGPEHLILIKPEEDEYDLVPPDGGWGWLVLAGSMLVNILIPGTIKSFGVLFIEFLEAFDASPSTAAWIPALCYFLYSSLGPISSILSIKYSYRVVTIMGGASAAIGMTASFWASSVTYLYISYGFFVGVGAGLSFPPTVYIVTSYFVKLRGLANGLCISGSALGSIILPPILRWLLEIYGYRGAILIMGGITLNVFVAAISYEPVEQHMIRAYNCKRKLKSVEEEDVGIVIKLKNATDLIDEKNHEKKICNEPVLYRPAVTKITNFPENLYKRTDMGRSASANVVQSFNNIDENFQTQKNKMHASIVIPQRNQTFTAKELHSQNSLCAVPEEPLSKLDKVCSLHKKSKLTRPSNSISSFQFISTPYHGSTLSFQPKEFSSHLSLRSVQSGSRSVNNIHDARVEQITSEQITDKGTKFFDLSLLTDPVYLVILVSNSTNAIGYTNFIILLPAYGVTLGFDKSLSAYLLSIVSATDLIGRIGGSALSDLEIIPKTWYYVGGLAISGISLALLPFSSSYEMVGFWCALFGLASGVYVGITAVIMSDMLGTDRLTSSYGISLFVNGVLQLIGPPLCGIWYEAVHKYDPLFHTLGVVLLLGSFLWCCMPFLKKKKM